MTEPNFKFRSQKLSENYRTAAIEKDSIDSTLVVTFPWKSEKLSNTWRKIEQRVKDLELKMKRKRMLRKFTAPALTKKDAGGASENLSEYMC